jgi:hypothetical protein
VEVKEQYQVKISNRFALEDFDYDYNNNVAISRTWESI